MGRTAEKIMHEMLCWVALLKFDAAVDARRECVRACFVFFAVVYSRPRRLAFAINTGVASARCDSEAQIGHPTVLFGLRNTHCRRKTA